MFSEHLNSKPTAMKYFYLLPLVLIFIQSCENDKTDPVIKEMSEVRGYKNWYIGEFRCGLFVPPTYRSDKKYPLIVYLHGHSDTTTWNLNWYNEPLLSYDPCIVLTPKCPIEERYGWGDSFDPRTSPMMAKAYEMIDLVEQAFNLDKDRYYINGTSMGGIGTYGVLQKNPDMFAAAYVLCGYPNVEIAPVIAEIPIWIFHGSEDYVVPVQGDRDLYNAVLELGGTQIKYTEYPRVEHNVWDYTDDETTLPYWLLAQKKGQVHEKPRNVENFTAEIMEVNKVFLQWNVENNNRENDNRVWYCRIYRNDILIKEVYNNHSNYTDYVITPGIYEYKISAVNFYFKESDKSDPVVLTLN